MKRFKNVGVLNIKGDVLKMMVDGMEEELKLENLLNVILTNAPFQTQQDSKEGALLAQAIETGKGGEFIELEESTHEWLKKAAEQVTPALFRVNGNVIYEYLKEGFEKIHQPEE